jgi:hypothetical protein
MNEYLKYKELYPEYLILIRCGKFYYIFGNDGYIINYFFDYQIIKNKVAFPEIILEKVKRVLELEQIAYLIVDKKILYSYKPKNYAIKYNSLIIECKKNYEYKKRIKNIRDKLSLCILTREIDEKLELIEKIL